MVSSPPSRARITRRGFFRAAACAAGGTAICGGEIDRHWIEKTHYDVHLPGLAPEFDGVRIAQLSDIHMDEFTEPFFVRDAVRDINRLKPDMVFLTGDFVTRHLAPRKFVEGSAWQCANLLNQLESKQRYAVLGNHDIMVNPDLVTTALRDNGIAVLRNERMPLERGRARLWLAGVDDPLEGNPDPGAAIPAGIRNQPNEPVIMLCHAPDYADDLLTEPTGQAVSFMLSGHTHGGQVRVPFLPPIHLPPLGRRYVEGWFRLGKLQLFVNRGLGAVGVPFRFDCAPEITLFTLRAEPVMHGKA